MKNPARPFRAHRGFTLVELMVAIAILMLLAAIALPVLSRVKEGGRTASCASNMKQLGFAFQQYLQDYNRYPGAGQYQKWGNGGHWVKGTNDTDAGSAGKLADLAGQEPIENVSSPTGYNVADIENGALFTYVKSAAVYICPSNNDAAKKKLSYSMNCAIAGMGLSRLKEPISIVLLVDEEKANDGFLYTGSGSTDAITQKHNGGGNLLFADGHVKHYPFGVFSLSAGSTALKTDTTQGKIRFQDLAFGYVLDTVTGIADPANSGFYTGTPVFGNCAAPN